MVLNACFASCKRRRKGNRDERMQVTWHLQTHFWFSLTQTPTQHKFLSLDSTLLSFLQRRFPLWPPVTSLFSARNLYFSLILIFGWISPNALFLWSPSFFNVWKFICILIIPFFVNRELQLGFILLRSMWCCKWRIIIMFRFRWR